VKALGTSKGGSGKREQSELALFLDMLRAERGAAEKTIEAYTRDLSEYLAFLVTKRKTALYASADTIRVYLAQLSRKGLAATSRARKLSAMRQFYRFLLAEGLRKDDPCSPSICGSDGLCRNCRLPSRGVAFCRRGAGRQTKARPSAALHPALLETLYATGLRVSGCSVRAALSAIK
jgi:integrase/recombinase XerD